MFGVWLELGSVSNVRMVNVMLVGVVYVNRVCYVECVISSLLMIGVSVLLSRIMIRNVCVVGGCFCGLKLIWIRIWYVFIIGLMK